MPPDLPTAILMAGLPIGAITFVLFAWAYRTGKVIPRDDWFDSTEEEIADLGQDLSEEVMGSVGLGAGDKAGAKTSNGYIMDKWVEFGGGYYGLMTTITFFHLELRELLELGDLLAELDGVDSFINTLLQFGIQLLIEAFTNMMHAFMWWNHWAQELPIAAGAGFVWLGASYAGYVLGEWLAGFFKKSP